MPAQVVRPLTAAQRKTMSGRRRATGRSRGAVGACRALIALPLLALSILTCCSREPVTEARPGEPLPTAPEPAMLASLGGDHAGNRPMSESASSAAPGLGDAEQIAHLALHDISIDPLAQCACADMRQAGGWCRRCGVGWLAGIRIPSADLYIALDSHGHQFVTLSVDCPSCLDAVSVDGHCDEHHRGFASHRMYTSTLAWAVARGRLIEPGSLNCDRCRTNAARCGWCDTCAAGQVGSLRFGSIDVFSHAMRERERLVESVRTLAQCEMCAIVMFTDATCPRHRPLPSDDATRTGRGDGPSAGVKVTTSP